MMKIFLLRFVVVVLLFLTDECDLFTHILQVCFTGTGGNTERYQWCRLVAEQNTILLSMLM